MANVSADRPIVPVIARSGRPSPPRNGTRETFRTFTGCPAARGVGSGPSRFIQQVPGAPLPERPLLARPLRREIAPPFSSLERTPLAPRAAEKVEGRDALHEFVRFRPPAEPCGILGARRGDAGDAGAEGSEVIAVDDDDLDAVAP